MGGGGTSTFYKTKQAAQAAAEDVRSEFRMMKDRGECCSYSVRVKPFRKGYILEESYDG